MNTIARVAWTGVLLALAVPVRAGEVKVTFASGLVTIVATDASPRQILAEWAKLGQVRITNLERLSGGPVTIQITNVSEAQALETLLRGTAGYVAAPRASSGDLAALSRYDRILLLPGAAPTVVPASPPPSNANRGRPVTVPAFDGQDDDQPFAQPRMMPGAGPMPQRFGSGMAVPGPTYSGMGQPTTQQVSPGVSRQIISTQNPQLPPGATGSSVPGVTTAPVQPPATPYSNGVPPVMFIQPDDVQTPGSATRPGAPAAPTPSATPGTPGAATPGATRPGMTTPGTTTPPGPVKKGPGAEG